MRAPEVSAEEKAALAALEGRGGPGYVGRRLERERAQEHGIFRPGTDAHRLRWLLKHGLIRASVRLSGLLGRGQRNARAIVVREHVVALPHLPGSFDGFTLLQLSDLHLDMGVGFADAVIAAVKPLRYDLCVVTGDYRGYTFGPMDSALESMARIRPALAGDVYAVLGNHDSIRMVPPLEAMGYRLLLNENVRIERGGEALYLAGIEDAHFFGLEDYALAAAGIPREAASILLSHTPDAYQEAEKAGFDLMLSGHTHGGQICLPGGMPLLTETAGPRAFARGSWRCGAMTGYTSTGSGTSVLDVRFNCPPEVTLHRLRRA